MKQIFRERQFLVSHLFINEKKEWHIFFFDQRDMETETKNHWKEGSHLHFMNYLWTGLELDTVWKSLDSYKGKFGSSIHIKWEE